MSGIRVTYSGLISMAGGLTAVFTGIFFTLILTRTLTTTEYGTWNLINVLIFYIMIIGTIVSYWTTREIARGLKSGTTAILSTGFLSVVGVVMYIIIALVMVHQANVDYVLLIFASTLIPFMFLNGVLTAINLGSKPQSVAYGSISLGIVQIIVGFTLIDFFNMRIYGAIITLMTSYVVSNLILFFYAKDKIKKNLQKNLLKKWIRHFWIPLYPGLTIVVAKLDIVIFTLMTGSVIGLAFWTAAMALPSTISNSGLISKAVYSKLLESKGDQQYIRENLIHLFYFAILFTSIAVAFARPVLFALNPSYEVAYQVTIFLAIYMFFNILSNVFISFLTGIEKVDVDENSTFRDYIKSKLFFLPTIRLIQYSTYVILLGIGLSFLIGWTSQLNMLTYWSIIILITEIPVTMYLYMQLKRNFSLLLDARSILKYLIVSVATFGAFYTLSIKLLQYSNSILEFLPTLLLFMGLGTMSYLIVTYVIDLRIRSLFKSIFNEMRSSFFK